MSKICRLEMSEIQKFYDNATVLITGGTGFLGKLLVDKLLRSCQSVHHIYLIMRNKNGFTTSERMEKYFEDPVFTRAKLENTAYKSQVTAIQGDIECDHLNLIPEDKELLIKNVTIIFHAAASLNFIEKIRVAVDLNVDGVKKVMNLAQQMTQLKSFVHISTVYSNCHLDMIDEKLYPMDVKYEEVVSLLRMYNDEELSQITPKLKGKAPNIYTFTKALAEQYIADNQSGLPIGIFRPAIIVSTFNEPIRGWIDNYYGPTGLITSAASGILHVIHGDGNVFSNIVPADLVVNAILACGWDIAQKREKLPIYNYVSTQNPLTWTKYVQLTKLGLDYPFSNSLWYFSLFFIRQKWIYHIVRLFIHILPAFIVDIILKVSNKKPRILRSYHRIHKFNAVLTYFINKKIDYKNDRILTLWQNLSDKDKQLFNFDIKTVDWNRYFETYIKGIREFMLKEDMGNLPDARTRYQRLFWVHQICKLSFFMLVMVSFYRCISI